MSDMGCVPSPVVKLSAALTVPVPPVDELFPYPIA